MTFCFKIYSQKDYRQYDCIVCCNFKENKVQIVIGNSIMISTKFLKLEKKKTLKLNELASFDESIM